MRIAIVIPALNEEATIASVVSRIPPSFAEQIIVVDNASTDATAELSRSAGATVIFEPYKGYGAACFAGFRAARDADVVVFDPNESWTVSNTNQHSNASYTLFEGQELLGRVKKVLCRGQLIVDGEELLGTEGYGEFLPTKAGNWQYRK